MNKNQCERCKAWHANLELNVCTKLAKTKKKKTSSKEFKRQFVKMFGNLKLSVEIIDAIILQCNMSNLVFYSN